MTDNQRKNLIDKLRSTGFPVAYWAFENQQTMPYICWLVPYSNNFAADGIVYQAISHLQIELYTPHKNWEVEEEVEKALADYVWYKTETYIESENAHQVIYEIEV